MTPRQLRDYLPDPDLGPDGFSPERLREIDEAFPEVEVLTDYGPPDDQGTIRVAATPLTRAHMPLRTVEVVGRGAEAARRAWARSTVPAEDVAKVRRLAIPMRDGVMSQSGLWDPEHERMLFNHNPQDTTFFANNDIPTVQSINYGQTVVHELGHAADTSLDALRGQRGTLRTGRDVPGYTDPADLGAVEKFADDYALEHYRLDPSAPEQHRFHPVEVTYPGRRPLPNPPLGLESYEGWDERADAAIQELAARYVPGTTPVTADQRSRLKHFLGESRP